VQKLYKPRNELKAAVFQQIIIKTNLTCFSIISQFNSIAKLLSLYMHSVHTYTHLNSDMDAKAEFLPFDPFPQLPAPTFPLQKLCIQIQCSN
jgi:hypothetical protein